MAEDGGGDILSWGGGVERSGSKNHNVHYVKRLGRRIDYVVLCMREAVWLKATFVQFYYLVIWKSLDGQRSWQRPGDNNNFCGLVGCSSVKNNEDGINGRPSSVSNAQAAPTNPSIY